MAGLEDRPPRGALRQLPTATCLPKPWHRQERASNGASVQYSLSPALRGAPQAKQSLLRSGHYFICWLATRER
jgi:hypothetical protein